MGVGGSRRCLAGKRRHQVRAPEHDERDEVVDVSEAVALPDRHPNLVCHRLDAYVGDAELDRAQDAVCLRCHHRLFEFGYDMPVKWYHS